MTQVGNGYIKNKKTFHELVKFGIVGVSTNLLGYLLFLAVTYTGVPYKLAMTVLYCVGVVISYLVNKSWTFMHQGGHISTSTKFLTAHFLGYCINLSMLFIGVDYLGYPYQLIQFIAIFVVAAFLFAIFKLFIFKKIIPDTGIAR